jgi:signal transduction histidine kinase
MKPPHLPTSPNGTAEQQRQAVADAVAHAYHDLSNPAAILSGNIQFLQAVSASVSDADAQDAIRDLAAGMARMEEELARLAGLREQLRDWAAQ